jgi:hypothetical protein
MAAVRVAASVRLFVAVVLIVGAWLANWKLDSIQSQESTPTPPPSWSSRDI